MTRFFFLYVVLRRLTIASMQLCASVSTRLFCASKHDFLWSHNLKLVDRLFGALTMSGFEIRQVPTKV